MRKKGKAMIKTGVKVSATQTLKDMLKKGWIIISTIKENNNTFLVTLKKLIQIGKNLIPGEKKIHVGFWALPKEIKTKDKPKHGSNRRGVHKLSRMNYA